MSADASASQPRRRDADETRRNIIAIGMEEFAGSGLAGARVDVIAARTRTTKRMIYYYFGDKEGLYKAVLEAAYTDIRRAEEAIDLSGLSPTEGIRRLVEFAFDYHEAHTDFTRLVMGENIQHGRLLREAGVSTSINQGILTRLDGVLRAGFADGSFLRQGVSLDVHMMISAFCFYRIANEHTFGFVHGVEVREPATRAQHRALVCDMVLCYLRAPTDAGA